MQAINSHTTGLLPFNFNRANTQQKCVGVYNTGCFSTKQASAADYHSFGTWKNDAEEPRREYSLRGLAFLQCKDKSYCA